MLSLALLVTGRGQLVIAQQATTDIITVSTQHALSYSSYLGGNSTDWVASVTSDSEGYLYLTGHTYSATFGGATHPHPGTMDAFVTKLSPDGSEVIFTTIFGGSGTDEAFDIAVEGAGESARIWVTGGTSSDDFPTLGAFQAVYGGGRDAFIAELTASGEVRFSSYFGSYGNDEAHALAIDDAGDVHLAGSMIGGFFAKVDGANHELVYYRMITGQDVTAEDIAIDGAGNLYYTGSVRSSDWPAEHAVQATCGASSLGGCTSDAFVVKLNAAGDTVLFSSYLGGSDSNGGSGTDQGQRIVIDSADNLYVVGETFASDFPTRNGWQTEKQGAANFSDLFVTKLTPEGAGYAIAYSSYLGGEWSEYARGIALHNGNLLLTGYTDSETFPLVGATQAALGPGICNVGGSERNCADGFVTQIDATGTLSFSSYLGGEFDDVGAGVVAADSDSWFVIGRTESVRFPVTADAQQPSKAGHKDLFVTRFAQAAPATPQSMQLYLPLVSR